MDRAQIAILIGLLSAVVLGYFTARSSARRKAIHGGTLAQILHYIGAGGVTGILPMVLAAIILGQGFELAFPMALSFMGTSLVALFLFALVEKPAHDRAEAAAAAQGWTEEKARSSGL